MSAHSAGTHPARDTVARALAARYPYLKPAQCELLESAIVCTLVIAAGGGCAVGAVRPQPDGTLDICILIIGSAALGGLQTPDPRKRTPL